MMGSHGCCKVGQSDVGLVKGGEGPKGESKRLMSKEGRVVLSLSEKKKKQRPRQWRCEPLGLAGVDDGELGSEWLAAMGVRQ